MRTPKIAVTVPRRQSTAFREYLQRIEQAGGDAHEVTPDQATVDFIEAIDGLMLPGGGDVEPARYGAAAHPETDGVRPDLDGLELSLIQLARERSLPVLAICRGHQIVNVALGGRLHQHIDGDTHKSVPTDAPQWDWQSRWHPVQIDRSSRLAALLGATELRVNSRHHQAVLPEMLAPDLRAVALSPDGFVEASEVVGGSWLLSVQWHPERREVIDDCAPLFAAFVQAANDRIATHAPTSMGSPVLR